VWCWSFRGRKSLLLDAFQTQHSLSVLLPLCAFIICGLFIGMREKLVNYSTVGKKLSNTIKHLHMPPSSSCFHRVKSRRLLIYVTSHLCFCIAVVECVALLDFHSLKFKHLDVGNSKLPRLRLICTGTMQA